MQEFTATSSVGKEHLQITVCPVAPFDEIYAMDFKTHTKMANHLRVLSMGIINAFNFSVSYNRTMSCLYDNQFVHREAHFVDKVYAIGYHHECMAEAWYIFSNDYTDDLLEVYTWIRSYLTLSMLRLMKEGDVDFYDRMYKNIDLLEQDNATLPEYLKAASRDSDEYIISDFTATDNANLNQPTQKIVVNELVTRFGSTCASYTLEDSEDGKKLNQRYQIQMSFSR